MSSVVEKYLRSYAEPEIGALVNFPSSVFFAQVLVIPVYKESPEFLDQFEQHQFANALIVIVINQPSRDEKFAEKFEVDQGYLPHPDNQSLSTIIKDKGRSLWRGENLELLNLGSFSVLIVDRFTQAPIPRKHGVGLARKIGCDIAACLINRKIVNAAEIYTSDADATLPDDYFDQVISSADTSAHVYSFRHLCDDTETGVATRNYERSIRYYVEGLKWAYSPYAFHTIGSCIAVSVVHYCHARGFPKRSGGEDFYLLNKLAKLGKVVELAGKSVLIEARESDRAPFGTGKSVAKMLATVERTFPDYDPRIFLALRDLHVRFLTMPVAANADQAHIWLDALVETTRAALLELGIDKFFEHARNQRYDAKQIAKHIPIWFDGFRTLKFVNHLQKVSFPPIPLAQALVDFEQLKQDVP